MKASENDWKIDLVEEIKLLGHRNWIVVTDMAYPLQSQAGIQTIYTDADYDEVLNTVHSIIEQTSHVRAIIYQDKELNLLDDNDIEGISAVKAQCRQILGDNVIYEDHEQLIAKLDTISKVFNVIILKTNLTIPYTSTFFELDCKYWDAHQQKMLEYKKS